ncbi:F-box domain-containing protein [Mycena kentingensis (nom. inval.)]|nr:F-box domain-containing protein [Mycena kentingensis (nom. inval.)]
MPPLLLDAERARLVEVDRIIAELENRLLVLRSEKQSLQSSLEAYKYPILTLPNEIMNEIFIQTLPDPPMPPRLLGIDSPRILLEICSHRRRVALSTPMLWCRLGVTIPESRCKCWARRPSALISLLHESASRSGCLPLSLEWRAGPTIALDDLVSRYHSRWRVLNLDIAQDDIERFSESGHPMLTELYLMNWDKAPDSPLRLGHTPILRSAAFWSIPFDASTLSWMSLTRLNVRDASLIHIVPALEAACGLVHCRLSVRTGLPIDHPPITLPRLETLILEAEQSDDGPDEWPLNSFDPFILPTLRRIRVEVDAFLLPDPIQRLQMFVKRSECQLEILALELTEVDVSSVKNLARKVTRIDSDSPGVSLDLANFDWTLDSWWDAQ